jgi:hypothetical protein
MQVQEEPGDPIRMKEEKRACTLPASESDRVAPREGPQPAPLTISFSQWQAKNSVKYLNLRNVISVIQT